MAQDQRICDNLRSALERLIDQHKAALTDSTNMLGATDRLRAKAEADALQENIDDLRRQLTEQCPDAATPTQDDYPGLVQRLADLFAAGQEGTPLPWGDWIEQVRVAVNRNLPPSPGQSAYTRADWLLQYTSTDQPLALALLRHAENHVACPMLQERIAALAGAVRDFYDIAPDAFQRLCATVSAALDKTALVLRLSGGEGDIYAFEVYEFWCQGADAAEGHRVLDHPFGGAHIDLAVVDDGKAPLPPGLVTRLKAVSILMGLLDRGRFGAGVEVVAPPGLMVRWDQAPEAWQSDLDLTLGRRHPLVLRSVAGFEGGPSHCREAHWQCVSNRKFKHHARDCTELTGDGIDRLRHDGRIATLEPCDRGADQLDACTSIGLSVVVWLRRAPHDGQTALDCLQTELKSCKVAKLPERLRDLRGKPEIDRDDPRFRIGLLMDNPRRRRPRQTLHRDG